MTVTETEKPNTWTRWMARRMYQSKGLCVQCMYWEVTTMNVALRRLHGQCEMHHHHHHHHHRRRRRRDAVDSGDGRPTASKRTDGRTKGGGLWWSLELRGNPSHQPTTQLGPSAWLLASSSSSNSLPDYCCTVVRSMSRKNCPPAKPPTTPVN